MLKQIIEKVIGNFPDPKRRWLAIGLVVLLTAGIALTPAIANAADGDADWLRLNIDPGVQAAIDAGFATQLDLTAQPVIREEGQTDPLDTIPAEYKAKELNLSQTIDDVTVTLDWIYRDISSANYN